jgi:hypothetical protein
MRYDLLPVLLSVLKSMGGTACQHEHSLRLALKPASLRVLRCSKYSNSPALRLTSRQIVALFGEPAGHVDGHLLKR